MEVVAIEKRIFLYICEWFTEFAKRMESLSSTHTHKVENWLDSQELCLLLNFSKRTLQYYRDDGVFPFIQLPGKVLFRESDIRKVLADRLRSAYDIEDYSL